MHSEEHAQSSLSLSRRHLVHSRDKKHKALVDDTPASYVNSVVLGMEEEGLVYLGFYNAKVDILKDDSLQHGDKVEFALPYDRMRPVARLVVTRSTLETMKDLIQRHLDRLDQGEE